MSLNESVGQNIKKYRQAYKMTLETLAGKIHKSKSTMSKYEKGVISLDVPTLEEIAYIFGISPAQLLMMPERLGSGSQIAGECVERQYMYSYDGRIRRVLKSVIERYHPQDGGQTPVALFYDVQDMGNPGECKTLYSGYSRKYEFIENYSLQNQSNLTEQATICCINSLSRTNKKIGLLTGLSYKTMLPVAIKVMISSSVLREDQELIASLELTKEDIKISKKYNLFTIDQFMD